MKAILILLAVLVFCLGFVMVLSCNIVALVFGLMFMGISAILLNRIEKASGDAD